MGSSAVPSLVSDWTGPDLLFRAKHLFLAAMVAISPCRAVRDEELALFGLNSIGNSLNPVDAKCLAACLCPTSNVPAADGAPTKVECRHNEPTSQFG
jgi:hypothetical protein